MSQSCNAGLLEKDRPRRSTNCKGLTRDAAWPRQGLAAKHFTSGALESSASRPVRLNKSSLDSSGQMRRLLSSPMDLSFSESSSSPSKRESTVADGYDGNCQIQHSAAFQRSGKDPIHRDRELRSILDSGAPNSALLAGTGLDKLGDLLS